MTEVIRVTRDTTALWGIRILSWVVFITSAILLAWTTVTAIIGIFPIFKEYID